MLLPVLVSVAFGSVLIGKALTRAHELRMIAPEEVRPGDPIPVRAVLFTDVDDPLRRGPLDGQNTSIEVHLEDPASGFASARVRLRPSRVLGAEGELLAPADAPSRLRLVAEARAPGGRLVRASRPIRIRAEAALPSRRALNRGDLGRLSLGPILRPDGAVSPDDLRFDLAVPAGACVPELPCRLVIACDLPLTASIENVAGVTQRAIERGARAAATNYLEAVVVVRGPEGLLDLVASREDEVVAKRRVRLPLAPGGIAVDVTQPVGSGDPGVIVRLLEDRPLAVDLYRDGRYIAALSIDVAGGDRGTRLALPRLETGLYRVQASRYPFAAGDGDQVGVGLFRVVPRRDGQEAPSPAIARTTLAPLAAELVQSPAPSSIDAAARAESARAFHRLRLALALLCVGAGLLAAFLLVRRGLAAELESSRLGGAHGTAPAESGAIPVEVITYGALVFLAFAAVGVLLYVYGG